MKAWLLDGLGGLGQLRLGEVPDPKPGEGEVVLAVEYAALNPADRYLAENLYPARPKFPHILGRDAIGTVIELGAGVKDFPVGEKRLVLRGDTGVNQPGTFAQRVAVPANYLAAVPSGWSDTEAAGAAQVYLTAHQAIAQWHDLPGNAVVLVTGASGGVGVACVHLAKAMGHFVVAQSRSAEKRKRLEAIGADITLDPQDSQWVKKLKSQLGERRVDLAIDNIGGPLLSNVMDTLGNLGRVSIVGRLAGPVPEFNTAKFFFRRIKMAGVSVGAYTNAQAQAAWKEVVTLMDRINAKPVVDQVFPFDQLLEGFKRLEAGPMGKVLLKVGQG